MFQFLFLIKNLDDLFLLMLLANITLSLQKLIWVMFSCYLIVDTLDGFFVQQLNISLRLSQLFKMSLILLILLVLAKWKSKTLIYMGMLAGLLFIGPFSRLLLESTSTFFEIDIKLAFRLFLLFLVTSFCIESYRKDPDTFYKWSHLALICGFWVVSFNVISGYLGLGFHTYKSTDVGFKGFFQAGNELSAIYIVLSSYYLHHCWNNRGLFVYGLLAFFVLIVGVSIGTKAGIIFSLLVVLLTPVANLRERIISVKSSAIILMLMSILFLLIYSTYPLVVDTPVYAKLAFAVERFDIVKLLFSGRDLHLLYFYNSLDEMNALQSVFLGPGADGVKHGRELLFIEIDPVDIFMYFGFPITALLTFLAAYVALKPISRIQSNYYAPFLILSNGALFFFAFIAGHVWTSGMAAIVWGISISFLYSRFDCRLNPMGPLHSKPENTVQ